MIDRHKLKRLIDIRHVPASPGSYLTAWAASIVTGAILIMVFRDSIPPTVLYAWYGTLVTLLILRLIVGLELHRHPEKTETPLWRRLYALLVTAVGVAWGSAIILFFIPGQQEHNLLLIIVAMGLISISSTLHRGLLYLLFTQPIALTLIYTLLMDGSGINALLALGIIIYDLVSIIIGNDAAKMEAQLRQARDLAEQASRAKSEFLANMSHEIRTPLNAIIGTGHLLKQTSPSPLQETYLETLLASSRALLGLVNNILDLSRIEAGKLEHCEGTFDLTDLLEEIKSIFGPEAERKGLSLRISERTIDTPLLFGDRQIVFQIVSNLISNAIKFSDTGGISVTVDAKNQGEKVALNISVSDNGQGITADKFEEIFGSFTQVHSDSGTHRGVGLGLAISRRLAEVIGGELTVESTPGAGSTFTFRANYQSAVSSGFETPSTSRWTPVQKPLRGIRVLLAEDDKFNQQVAVGLLHSAGADVCVASDGATMIELVKTERPDVALLDIQMPGIDGYEAAQKIREISGFDKLPIIALTAHALSEVREKALAAGMNDFLSKPVDPQQLFQTILHWTHAVARDSSPLQRDDMNGKPLSNIDVEPSPTRGDNTRSIRETRNTLAAVTATLGEKTSKEIFSRAADSLPERLNELAGAFENGDYETAASQVHQLKGMMFIFGNSRLKDLLDKLGEKIAEQQEARQLINELREEVNTTLSLLDKQCG